MSESLVQRAITVVITAGPYQAPVNGVGGYNPPTFGPNKSNTITLSGYRVLADISLASGLSAVQAEITISNLNVATANSLASIGNQFYVLNKNVVSVLAGDSVNGMSLVFSGNISSAFPDFSDMPNAGFNITATEGLQGLLLPVSPTSFSGSVNVATIMQQLATLAGYGFENNGVTSVLSNPYLPGTAMDQIRSVANAADINFIVDKNVLAIWPKTGYRGGGIPVVSPATGLWGYPSYNALGINFRTLFNPQLQFGSLIQMQSSLQPACGKWSIYSLSHSLECQSPGGAWFSDVQCQIPGGVTIGQ